MTCPRCASQPGSISEQHWAGDHTVMTEQQVCKCGWKGEIVALTEFQRAAIDAEVAAGSGVAFKAQGGVRLKDLPASVRKLVQEQASTDRK